MDSRAATNDYFHSRLIYRLFYRVVLSIKCKKMAENVEMHFPKSKLTSSNVLFCPQHKDNEFTVIEEERNQKIFTFKKLE